MVLDASFLMLSLIRYGSRVSGAIHGNELPSPLPLAVGAIKQGVFGLPLTMVGQLIYYYYI